MITKLIFFFCGFRYDIGSDENTYRVSSGCTFDDIGVSIANMLLRDETNHFLNVILMPASSLVMMQCMRKICLVCLR
jgi:hypothetical protein